MTYLRRSTRQSLIADRMICAASLRAAMTGPAPLSGVCLTNSRCTEINNRRSFFRPTTSGPTAAIALTTSPATYMDASPNVFGEIVRRVCRDFKRIKLIARGFHVLDLLDFSYSAGRA